MDSINSRWVSLSHWNTLLSHWNTLHRSMGVQKKKIYETSSKVANKKIMCRLSVCFRQKGAAVCQLALAVYFLYHLQSHRYGEARRQWEGWGAMIAGYCFPVGPDDVMSVTLPSVIVRHSPLPTPPSFPPPCSRTHSRKESPSSHALARRNWKERKWLPPLALSSTSLRLPEGTTCLSPSNWNLSLRIQSVHTPCTSRKRGSAPHSL